MRTGTRRALGALSVAIGAAGTAASVVHTARRRRGDAFWRDLSTDIHCGTVFYRARLDTLAREEVQIGSAELSQVLNSEIPGFAVDAGTYFCDVEFEHSSSDPVNLIRVRVNGNNETLLLVAERLRLDRELGVRNISGPTDFGGQGEVTFTVVVLDADHKDVLAVGAKMKQPTEQR